jgi:hypothetical protein
MKTTSILLGAVLIVLAGGPSLAALVPADHPLFDGDAVHQIYLTFDQPDYWTQLTDNFEDYDDPPYLEATLDWESTSITIGVRFKGNSSYWGYYGNKKSFKLDIDEFVPGQEIDGLDKFSLNNCFLDPSYVREKATYELCEAMGMATCRTNYAAVYINGTYWGLYLLVEQQDQEFIESRYGSGEDGNLWKGEPYGTLEYLGSSEVSYYDNYELKTNEVANDWSDLVDFIDQINNTSVSVLADSLHNRLDVNSALAMLAIDNFTVNLDSYVGRCANFYFYHRDLDDRFVFTKWDQNEAFGVFNMYGLSTTQMQQLSPYWTNTQFGEDRPLADALWSVPDYVDIYLGHMQKLMTGAADPTTLVARMEELRDMIRTWVYADPNTMFSSSDFENCMTTTIYASGGPPPGRPIPALQTFINARHSYLSGSIGTWTPIEGLVINEVMAKNTSTVADGAGDYDDWIEIANTSGATINLSGLGLTDHLEGVPDYVFPNVSLAPGECLVVWADEEIFEGDLHTPFKLDGDGEQVYLTDGAVIIDQVTFPALGNDIPWGRWPHGTGEWSMLSLATPGAENQNPEAPETVVLYINEFMAQNNAGIQDEAGSYEDWLEIYNPGPEAVEMAGLFLTDDLALTTQWAFPDTLLEAGEFMLVWCDNDEGDGPLHTSFKLGASGEEIGLYGRLAAGNLVIDSIVFGAQIENVSEGRETDGGAPWISFAEPTPGASNAGETDAPSVEALYMRMLPNYPNPFNPQTVLRFEIPADAHVRLELFDARGRLVSLLRDEVLTAGTYETVWTGRDDAGREMTSGVYYSRLTSDLEVCTGRLMLIR